MSKDDKYFQFPISALQMKKPLEKVTTEQMVEVANTIIEYSVVEAGKAFKRTKNEDVIEAVLKESEHCLEDVDELSEHKKDLILGFRVCNVSLNGGRVSDETFKKNWELLKFRKGGEKQLRLRNDIVWDVKNQISDLKWRDFAILCAVYAGIGAASTTRLSFEYIGCMSLGYSSKEKLKAAHMQQLIPKRHTVRYTVRKLADRGFFTYLSPNKRHNYYSNSTSAKGLVNVIVEKEKNDRELERQEATRLLRERIEALGKKPKKQSSKATEQQRQKLNSQIGAI
jgi:hypothetical protein